MHKQSQNSNFTFNFKQDQDESVPNDKSAGIDFINLNTGNTTENTRQGDSKNKVINKDTHKDYKLCTKNVQAISTNPISTTKTPVVVKSMPSAKPNLQLKQTKLKVNPSYSKNQIKHQILQVKNLIGLYSKCKGTGLNTLKNKTEGNQSISWIKRDQEKESSGDIGITVRKKVSNNIAIQSNRVYCQKIHTEEKQQINKQKDDDKLPVKVSQVQIQTVRQFNKKTHQQNPLQQTHLNVTTTQTHIPNSLLHIDGLTAGFLVLKNSRDTGYRNTISQSRKRASNFSVNVSMPVNLGEKKECVAGISKSIRKLQEIYKENMAKQIHQHPNSEYKSIQGQNIDKRLTTVQYSNYRQKQNQQNFSQSKPISNLIKRKTGHITNILGNSNFNICMGKKTHGRSYTQSNYLKKYVGQQQQDFKFNLKCTNKQQKRVEKKTSREEKCQIDKQNHIYTEVKYRKNYSFSQTQSKWPLAAAKSTNMSFGELQLSKNVDNSNNHLHSHMCPQKKIHRISTSRALELYSKVFKNNQQQCTQRPKHSQSSSNLTKTPSQPIVGSANTNIGINVPKSSFRYSTKPKPQSSDITTRQIVLQDKLKLIDKPKIVVGVARRPNLNRRSIVQMDVCQHISRFEGRFGRLRTRTGENSGLGQADKINPSHAADKSRFIKSIYKYKRSHMTFHHQYQKDNQNYHMLTNIDKEDSFQLDGW